VGIVMTKTGGIWLGRRPSKGLLGGLWALPSMVTEDTNSLQDIGLRLSGDGKTVKHAFTHQVWMVTVFQAEGKPRDGEFESYRAFTLDEIADMGIAGPSLKALRKMGFNLPHRRGAG
jgi:adenine-specific DNA glycosylase